MMTPPRTAFPWQSVVALVAALLLCSASLFAEEPACKSKGEVKVVYPDVARRMKIGGTVRLLLQLTPSGSVRETTVLGGNPILASAAEEAVKHARYQGTEPCIAQFHFSL